MADLEYTDDVATQPMAVSGFGAWTQVLGALVSLGLIIGVAVWGYKLVVRDVSGVPVVRAIDGPMRVQPKDPGGRQADNQGLAVNTIAAQGSVAAPADRLLLAPKPVTLADEDAPMGEMKPTVLAAASGVVSDGVINTDTGSEAAVADFVSGSIDALVDELTAGIEPMADVTPTDEDDPQVITRIVQPEALNSDVSTQAVMTPAALVVVKGPGPKRSLRPQVRPTGALLLARSEVGNLVLSSLDVDPDSIPAGTRLVQLGIADSPEKAREKWDQMHAKFGDYLYGKSRVIQKATRGGKVFYRLRAMGFDDLSAARRFCSALVAENAECIPVAVR